MDAQSSADRTHSTPTRAGYVRAGRFAECGEIHPSERLRRRTSQHRHAEGPDDVGEGGRDPHRGRSADGVPGHPRDRLQPPALSPLDGGRGGGGPQRGGRGSRGRGRNVTRFDGSEASASRLPGAVSMSGGTRRQQGRPRPLRPGARRRTRAQAAGPGLRCFGAQIHGTRPAPRVPALEPPRRPLPLPRGRHRGGSHPVLRPGARARGRYSRTTARRSRTPSRCAWKSSAKARIRCTSPWASTSSGSPRRGCWSGRAGRESRAVGSRARTKIEHLLGRRVYLDLWVKVWQGWRRKKEGLMAFGYRAPDDVA